MTKKQKLELTWIGKENRPKLEQRPPLENSLDDWEKSYHELHGETEYKVFLTHHPMTRHQTRDR